VNSPLPESVHASVLERIGRLDRRARATLLCAAAIGRRFDVRVLAAAVGRAPEVVRADIEAGCTLQLVEPDAHQGECFLFRHALTHDALYGELLATRTQALHRRIAHALERSDDATLEEVAYHWWAGRSRRRGPSANERAGDHAAALHAPQLARVHYQRALHLTDAGSATHRRLTRKLLAFEA
jgi:adenylate cyclase